MCHQMEHKGMDLAKKIFDVKMIKRGMMRR